MGKLIEAGKRFSRPKQDKPVGSGFKILQFKMSYEMELQTVKNAFINDLIFIWEEEKKNADPAMSRDEFIEDFKTRTLSKFPGNSAKVLILLEEIIKESPFLGLKIVE